MAAPQRARTKTEQGSSAVEPDQLTSTDRARLALFAVVATLIGLALWRARIALAPFAVGLVLAYILVPLVDRVQRRLPGRLGRAPQSRMLAVLLVYVAVGTAVTLVAAAIVPAAIQQAGELIVSLPTVLVRVQGLLKEAVTSYESGLTRLLGDAPPDSLGPLLEQLAPEEVVADVAGALLTAARAGAEAALRAVSGTLTWMLAFVVIPFWMVYLVSDNQRLLKGATDLVPSPLRGDVQSLATIVDSILSAYIRGQLIIAVFLGSLATVAMALIGAPYALLIGFATGVLGLIPFLGAILGAVVAVVVALTVSVPLAVKALLAYVVVQQIDNFLITPRTHSEAVSLHPAVIMVVLAAGGALLGPVGLLVAVPVAAILRDSIHYVYLRIGSGALSFQEALTTVGYGKTKTEPAAGA